MELEWNVCVKIDYKHCVYTEKMRYKIAKSTHEPCELDIRKLMKIELFIYI